MLFLKNFIAGMIFATTIAPILDSITALAMTGIETIKGKWTVKITEYNHQIQQIGLSEESQSVQVCGFVIPEEKEAQDEE